MNMMGIGEEDLKGILDGDNHTDQNLHQVNEGIEEGTEEEKLCCIVDFL